jgi:putative DNA modification/repair radical SAM protein
MDLSGKLAILADAAKYDASCASSGAKRGGRDQSLGHNDGTGICHSYTPDGRCVSLLKILLTNFCVYDCLFCVNRVSSDIPRAKFTPEEVVALTLDFYRRNYIEGLFLSSGIMTSPDVTMEQMVRVARLLREEHRFNGYIHLKVIPGASPELIAEAGRWADRLSANIELPTQADLDRLAPEKTVAETGATMHEIHEHAVAAAESPSERFAPAGQTTQLIVGATETDDRTILATASTLYREYSLKRIYYSAFSPFPRADARLPIAAPALVREHRLYQADWLMRRYGFDATELTSEDDRDLDLARDPKLSWALRNRGFFPVDVNAAPREALLRVPGLGYRNVTRILQMRRHHRVTLADLVKLRVITDRARPFLVTADFDPQTLLLDSLRLEVNAPETQLSLFATAVGGEL